MISVFAILVLLALTYLVMGDLHINLFDRRKVDLIRAYNLNCVDEDDITEMLFDRRRS